MSNTLPADVEENNETNVCTEQFENIDLGNSENGKNKKFQNQIEMLKLQIKMLVKACLNYKQGIKEMNGHFGWKNTTDDLASIQIFKNIMQELQRTNAHLLTERIELQVKAARYADDLERTRCEKDNINKKFLNADQLAQRLQLERSEFEANYKRQLEVKQNEVAQLNSQVLELGYELDLLKRENESLLKYQMEYEQLQVNHNQLTEHYEQLYNQASEIVNGNQLLNEQVNSNTMQIAQLEQLIEEYQLKLDHLEQCNSELNTQKINLDMKMAELELKLESNEEDLKQLEDLKVSKQSMEKLMKQFKELETELIEKNELIDQLNQAKEFLVENNSKLLTNNIKIQLFVESMGLDLEHLEANASVKEYEFLRNQFKEAQAEINELKLANKEIEINMHIHRDQIVKKEKECVDLQNKFLLIEDELKNSKTNILDKIDAFTQLSDESEYEMRGENDLLKKELNEAELMHQQAVSGLHKTYSDQLIQFEHNFNQIQNENDLLRSEIAALNTKLNTLNDTTTNSDKLNAAEQQIVKLKAKLKQYIKLKQQHDESKLETENLILKLNSSNSEIAKLNDQIKLFEAMRCDATQAKSLHLDEEKLVRFGSILGATAVQDHVRQQLIAVKEANNVFVLNNQLKLADLDESLHEFKIKCELLSAVNKRLMEVSNQEIPNNDEIDRLKMQLESAKTNEKLLMQQLNCSQNELDLATSRIDSLNLSIENFVSNEAKTKKELEAGKKKYDTLRAKAQSLKERLKQHENNSATSSQIFENPLLNSEQEEKHQTSLNDLHKYYAQDLHDHKQRISEQLAKIEALNIELNEVKLNHEQAVGDVHKMYSDQLTQFEQTFNQIQDENDTLKNDNEELKTKLSALNNIEVNYRDTSQRLTQTLTKLSSLEQQSLKLRVKLKQMLKQKQQQEAATLLQPCSILIPGNFCI